MDLLEIDKEQIPKGTHATLELNIARLPSGTQIHMPVHVYRSKQNGPTVLLSGGLHGDEVNGIETVRRIIDSKILHKLRIGSVIALPIINIYGFLNFSRDVPDGKDVNRSFPGSENGSLASLVANTLTRKILPAVDFGIDFHTGGASRTNYPQVRFAKDDKKSEDLAWAFGAPFIMHSSLIDGSLRKQAFEMGKSIIVFEGGESLRFDEFSIKEAFEGILRTLYHFGMILKKPKDRKHNSLFFSQTSWVRAETSGLFRSLKKSGQKVKKGEVIGLINNPGNLYEIKVEAHESGFIIGHNNIPVINRGDALFHIGLT